MSFERRVEFHAAWDRRNADPKQNYGIHGVEILFVLIGAAGAVQFLLFTNWMLPEVEKEQPNLPRSLTRPMPADLGYHGYSPLYERQEPTFQSCEILGGKPCYYDGSSLNADPVFEVLLREGDAGVWRELEARYNETFKVPAATHESSGVSLKEEGDSKEGEIRAEVKRETIAMDGSSLPGRLAQLIANGFFKTAKRHVDAKKELERTGPQVHNGNLSRELKSLVHKGFLTDEGDGVGYVAVPGMKVHIVERRAGAA